MKAIYKYPITREPIELPIGAVVVCCNTQKGEHCIWALVDTAQPLEHRRFEVVGTGSLSNDEIYVGTFFEDPFVWHVVETKT